LIVFVLLAIFQTDFYRARPISTWIITVIILLATICGHWAAAHVRGGLAFIGTGVTLAGIIAFIFNGLFPRVLIATDPKFSLLIKDASASPKTLNIMTIVLVCLLPVVLVYFIWSYYIQRKRISLDDVQGDNGY
jgi:cytochrome d ubiquinol oxidase subunit II